VCDAPCQGDRIRAPPELRRDRFPRMMRRPEGMLPIVSLTEAEDDDYGTHQYHV
jgi:hypothetical protein